jgi:hypothetical protein
MSNHASAAPVHSHGRGVELSERLLTRRAVIGIWIGYALVNALIRAFFSVTLSTDDAASSAIAQSFQLGYQRGQPPLWEWLLVAIQQVLGPGIASHLLLRYTMIAVIGVAVFRACLAASGNTRWSAAMSLSYPLIYQLGWPLFEWGTQTLLLAAACLFTFEAALYHCAKPTWRTASLFGVAVGIGLLSKFGFALYMAALAIALLLRPQTRAGLLHISTALSALIAMAIVSPYLLWIVHNSIDLGQVFQHRLVGGSEPHWWRSLAGFGRLLGGMPGVLAPWIVVVAGLWWMGRRAGPARSEAALGERVARDITFAAIALFIGGIVAFGTNQIKGGYLPLIAMPLLPWAAALLSRAGPARGENMLATLSVIVLAGLTLGRVFALANGGITQDAQMGMLWPYRGLAQAIEQRGFDGATIIAASTRDAGNLRALLPQARVRVAGVSVIIPHRPSHGIACIIVLPDASTAPAAARWVDRHAANLDHLIAGRPREVIVVPWPPTLLGTPRISQWLFAKLDPREPVCR